MSKEVVKNTKLNKLSKTINNLENETSDGTTLIHINPFNKDKQNFLEKNGDVDNKIPDTSILLTPTVL